MSDGFGRSGVLEESEDRESLLGPTTDPGPVSGFHGACLFCQLLSLSMIARRPRLDYSLGMLTAPWPNEARWRSSESCPCGAILKCEWGSTSGYGGRVTSGTGPSNQRRPVDDEADEGNERVAVSGLSLLENQLVMLSEAKPSG